MRAFANDLFEYQIGPALVLSADTRVFAGNEGSLRLIDPLLEKSGTRFENELVGQSVRNLRIILTPGCRPVYRDWDAFFEAVRSSKGPSQSEGPDDVRRHSSPQTGDEDEDARWIRKFTKDSESFWDRETNRHPKSAETDVIIQAPQGQSRDDDNQKKSRPTISIKSRMHISQWSRGNIDLYLVLFRRTFTDVNSTLVDAKGYQGLIKGISHPTTTSNTATIASSPSQSPGSVNSNTKEFDLTTPEDIEIQNQLIPHIMAILSPEGQAMVFSESWYQFCGLTEAESIGSGWASVIHPDDVKGKFSNPRIRVEPGHLDAAFLLTRYHDLPRVQRSELTT